MKGIIVFYINFHPEHNQDIKQMIALVKETNADLFEKIKSDMGYQVAIVPTTKEACRIEKIDLDKPFPRFVAKTHIDLGEVDRRRAERDEERRKANSSKESNREAN